METSVVGGRWSAWALLGLVAVNAGWMAFDGARALVVGDYVTPTTGRFAGQLGPWSRVVEAAGLEPRSTFVKSIFLGYGLAYLAAAIAVAASIRWGWHAAVVLAVLGLWYLPFGTAINAVVLVLLFRPELRARSKGVIG